MAWPDWSWPPYFTTDLRHWHAYRDGNLNACRPTTTKLDECGQEGSETLRHLYHVSMGRSVDWKWRQLQFCCSRVAQCVSDAAGCTYQGQRSTHCATGRNSVPNRHWEPFPGAKDAQVVIDLFHAHVLSPPKIAYKFVHKYLNPLVYRQAHTHTHRERERERESKHRSIPFFVGDSEQFYSRCNLISEYTERQTSRPSAHLSPKHDQQKCA